MFLLTVALGEYFRIKNHRHHRWHQWLFNVKGVQRRIVLGLLMTVNRWLLDSLTNLLNFDIWLSSQTKIMVNKSHLANSPKVSQMSTPAA